MAGRRYFLLPTLLLTILLITTCRELQERYISLESNEEASRVKCPLTVWCVPCCWALAAAALYRYLESMKKRAEQVKAETSDAVTEGAHTHECARPAAPTPYPLTASWHRMLLRR